MATLVVLAACAHPPPPPVVVHTTPYIDPNYESITIDHSYLRPPIEKQLLWWDPLPLCRSSRARGCSE